MKPLRRGWRRFLGVFGGWRNEGDLADELTSHIEMQTEDNLRAGMDAAAHAADDRLLADYGLAWRTYFHVRGLYLQDWIKSPDFPFVWRLSKKVAGSGAHGDLCAHSIGLARSSERISRSSSTIAGSAPQRNAPAISKSGSFS